MVFTRTLALLLGAGASASLAQTPPAAAAQPSDFAMVTLKSSAKIVVVDVVVTDRNHNAIHDLPKSEFTLLEGKKPQAIKGFEEHKPPAAGQGVKFDPMPQMPRGIFTNYEPAPINSALNILLLDTLNTPLADQAFVRQQITDYLKKARPETSIAIFGLTTHLIMLQGFTADPEILRKAVNGKNMASSPLLDDPTNGGATETMSEMMTASGLATAQATANMATFESMQQSFQLQLRAKYTLDALNDLARYLTNLPGRKNLIWFSGSFPLDILPDAEVASVGGDPFAGVADSEEEYRETTNMLARSQVAVYPVDARGLMVAPMFSASNSGAKYARNPTAFGADNTRFFNQTSAEHATMQRMAEDTGGEAFINTNGLSQAVAKAIDNGSSYYTLSYTPTNTNWNGDFRDIKVTLERAGYTLAYRHGYYADDPDVPSTRRHPITPATAAKPAMSSLQVAMIHGAPNPGEILFKVRIIPASTETEPAVAPGNKPDPNAKVAKPPFRRFAIDYALDAHMVKFIQAPDGNMQGALSWVASVYDPNGRLINFTTNDTRANLSDAAYKAFMKTGVPYHQEISVPDKGAYYIRVGMQDLLTGHIGTVEVPVEAVKGLPPVAAVVAPAAGARP